MPLRTALPGSRTKAKPRPIFAKLRWLDGVPRCDHDRVYETRGLNPDRPQWKCGKCRRKFSCTTGTIFKASHIPMKHWLFAMLIICTSKKGRQRHAGTADVEYHLPGRLIHDAQDPLGHDPGTSDQCSAVPGRSWRRTRATSAAAGPASGAAGRLARPSWR